MSNQDIRRNGSGYYDPTAYHAIRSMAEPGDIFQRSDRDNEVLVLKKHGTVYTVLYLGQKESPDTIPIRSRCIRYTNPCMLQFLFNQQLGQFIKTLPEQEFRAVVDAACRAFDVRPIARQEEPQAVSDDSLPQCVAEFLDSQKKLFRHLLKGERHV